MKSSKVNKSSEYENGLVSIAIPAYKRTYLAEAIESTLNQTYNNIELIIVNDHSPYDLDSVVGQYDDKRIRYYKNRRNLGRRSIVYNWNRCIDYAKGEFFVLLCDDDVLMPNFVSDLLKLAAKYPKCNVFHARKIEKDENTGSLTNTPGWPEFEEYESFIKQYFNNNRRHTISEFMYRTSTIKRIKYKVFPVGFYSDDVSLIQFSIDGGIASSNESLLMFRFSDEHISSNGNYNIGKVRAMRKYLRWIKRNSCCKKYYTTKKEQETSIAIEYFLKCNGLKKIITIPYLPWTRTNLRIIRRELYKMILN